MLSQVLLHFHACMGKSKHFSCRVAMYHYMHMHACSMLSTGSTGILVYNSFLEYLYIYSPHTHTVFSVNIPSPNRSFGDKHRVSIQGIYIYKVTASINSHLLFQGMHSLSITTQCMFVTCKYYTYYSCRTVEKQCLIHGRILLSHSIITDT